MTPMLQVSPLSPERVWAILESGTFIQVPRPIQAAPIQASQPHSSQHPDGGSDFFPWNQCRPVGDNLPYWRAALAEPGGVGRAIKDERDQFACKAVDGFAVGAADADADLHLGRIRAGLSYRAVAGVHAEKLGI